MRRAHDRRRPGFWSSFNQWWRTEFEKHDPPQRPSADEIARWYAETAWDPPCDKPSLTETRMHAKCLRDKTAVRDYFRERRARQKSEEEAESEFMELADSSVPRGQASAAKPAPAPTRKASSSKRARSQGHSHASTAAAACSEEPSLAAAGMASYGSEWGAWAVPPHMFAAAAAATGDGGGCMNAEAAAAAWHADEAAWAEGAAAWSAYYQQPADAELAAAAAAGYQHTDAATLAAGYAGRQQQQQQQCQWTGVPDWPAADMQPEAAAQLWAAATAATAAAAAASDDKGADQEPKHQQGAWPQQAPLMAVLHASADAGPLQAEVPAVLLQGVLPQVLPALAPGAVGSTAMPAPAPLLHHEQQQQQVSMACSMGQDFASILQKLQRSPGDDADAPTAAAGAGGGISAFAGPALAQPDAHRPSLLDGAAAGRLSQLFELRLPSLFQLPSGLLDSGVLLTSPHDSGLPAFLEKLSEEAGAGGGQQQQRKPSCGLDRLDSCIAPVAPGSRASWLRGNMHLPEDWQQQAVQLGLAPFNVGRAAMASPAAVAAADAGGVTTWWGAALMPAPNMPGQQQPSKRAREPSAAELALAAADSLFDVQGTSSSSRMLPPERKRVCSGGRNPPAARGEQRQLPPVLVPQALGVPVAQGPEPPAAAAYRFVLDLRSPQSRQDERQQLAGVASGPPQGPTAVAGQQGSQEQQTRAPCAALDLRPDDLGQTSENGSRQPEGAGQGNAVVCERDNAVNRGGLHHPLLALISPPAGWHGPSTAASTTAAWVARTGPGGVPLPPPAMASVSAAAAAAAVGRGDKLPAATPE